MTKLVLHIGGHRTGSTSVQAALHASRKRLGRAGILYPTAGLSTVAHHSLANAIREAKVEGGGRPALSGCLEGLHREIRLSKCHTVIISSEELISTCDYRPDGLSQLFALFSEVQVLCFLRHQAPLLESAYKFAVLWSNSAATEAFPEYLRHHTLGDHLLYKHIEPFFRTARADITFDFVSFLAAQRSGSLVKHFYEKAGIAEAYSGEVHTNESLSRAGTISLLLRNRNELLDPLRRGAFVRFARRTFPESHESLFTPELLDQVAQRFHDSNEELAGRFGFSLNEELCSFRQRNSLAGWDLSTVERAQLDGALRRRSRFPLLSLAKDYLPSLAGVRR